jgi:hypothetical protein
MAWTLFIVIEDTDTGDKRWLPINNGLEFLDAVEEAETLAQYHETAQAGRHEWLEPE